MPKVSSGECFFNLNFPSVAARRSAIFMSIQDSGRGRRAEWGSLKRESPERRPARGISLPLFHLTDTRSRIRDLGGSRRLRRCAIFSIVLFINQTLAFHANFLKPSTQFI